MNINKFTKTQGGLQAEEAMTNYPKDCIWIKNWEKLRMKKVLF